MPRKNNNWKITIKKSALKSLLATKGWQEIADLLGCSKSGIRRLAKQYGISTPRKNGQRLCKK